LPAAARRVFATGGSGGAPTDFDRQQRYRPTYANVKLKSHQRTRTDIREILLTIVHSFKQFFKPQGRKQSVIVSVTSEQMSRHPARHTSSNK